jgi:hypothetical protein
MAAKSPNTRAYVMLANFSDQTLIVPKSTVHGIAEEASEALINRIKPKKHQNPIGHKNFRGRGKTKHYIASR